MISPFLLAFYNKLFQDSEYPSSWNDGIVVPVFKGGNIDDVKNYRGITLNNILAKIYSRILSSRLSKWAVDNNIIIDNQYGFQKNKSTVDCVFILYSLIAKTLSNKKKLYVAFLDWEKMFDKINRVLLWQKLVNTNISTKLISSIKAMYTEVKSSIRYKGSVSRPINSFMGVKQGDSLSSILCLFFLNDILENINSNVNGILSLDEEQLFMLMFADDGIVFSENPESLQLMLNDIERYCHEWKLKLNVNKTKIMIFEKGRPTYHHFVLNNSVIEVVNSFKYLGVYFYKNISWKETQKQISQRASISLHNLFIVFNQTELPTSQKLKLFDSMILPILQKYGVGMMHQI